MVLQMDKRKLVSWLVRGLNIGVILVMLLFSVALLAFSLPESPSLFGYHAILQAPSRFGETSGADCLLVYRPPTAEQLPSEGMRILLQGGAGELIVGTVRSVDETSVTYVTDSGREDSFSPDAEAYMGTVSVESTFWGQVFAMVAAPENVPITYTVIALTFLLCILMLALIYAVSTRSEKPEIPFPDEAKTTAADGLPGGLRALRSSGTRTGPLWERPANRRTLPGRTFAKEEQAPPIKPMPELPTGGQQSAAEMVPEVILGAEPLEIRLPSGGPEKAPRPAFLENSDLETQVVIHTHLSWESEAEEEPEAMAETPTEEEPMPVPPSLAELLDEIERQFQAGLTGEEEKETI